MKKTKKVLSFVLALSMLCTVFGTSLCVSAATDSTETYSGDRYALPSGWTLSRANYSGGPAWNLEQDYVGMTFNKGVDGGCALVVNRLSEYFGNRFIQLSVPLVNMVENAEQSYTVEAGKTYRLSFDMKGTVTGGLHTSISWLGDKTGGMDNFNAVASKDGFTNYYRDIAIETGTDTADKNKLLFIFNNPVNCIIDNVSLKEVVDGTVQDTEYVKNGTCDNPVYDFSGINYGDVKLTSNWNYSMINSSGGSTADKQTEVNNGTFVTGTKIARTGNYALYAVWNSASSGKYIKIVQPDLTPDTNSQYVVEFWAKGNNVGGLQVGPIWNTGYGNATGNPVETDDNGWVKYKSVYTPTSSENFNFKIILQQQTSAIIDDIKFYKDVNANGEFDEGEINLVMDGGFEGSYTNGKDELGKYEFTDFTLANGSKGTVEPGRGYLTNDEYAEAKGYSEPDDFTAKSGNYSLHIQPPTLKANQTTPGNFFYQLQFDNNTGQFSADKKYKYSFWAKGGVSNVVFGSNWACNYLDNILPSQTDADGWTQYTLEQQGTTEGFQMIFNVGDDVWIDDLEITEVATNTKVLSYDFENVRVKSNDVDGIKHLMAATLKQGNGLYVTWTNPMDYIKRARVFVDGKEVNVPADLSTERNAFCEMSVNGLTNGTTYDVEVRLLLENGKTITATTKGTPDEKGTSYTLRGWTVSRNRGYGEHNSYFMANLDSVVSKSGNSMRLDLNKPVADGSYYPAIIQKFKVNKKDEHVLTFDTKSDGIDLASVIINYSYTDSESVTHNSWKMIDIEKSSEWANQKTVLNKDVLGAEYCDSNATINNVLDAEIIFMVKQGTGSIWFDNMYFGTYDEMAEEGEGYGANLFANGTFDESYKITTAFTDESGNEITVLKAGTINVNAKVKNEAVDEGLNAFVAIAVYKDGVLEQLVKAEGTVAVSGEFPTYNDEFTGMVTIPEEGANKYSIKVMYWNGEDTMQPYVTAAELKPAAVAE